MPFVQDNAYLLGQTVRRRSDDGEAINKLTNDLFALQMLSAEEGQRRGVDGFDESNPIGGF